MRTAVVFAVLSLSMGCASSRDPGQRGGDQERLTREQILETGIPNLYDVVRRLRPRWLTDRSPSGSGEIVVYQNQAPMGGVDALRLMDPEGVYSMEWLSQWAAAERLPGLGLGGATLTGVIVVWTRPPGDG